MAAQDSNKDVNMAVEDTQNISNNIPAQNKSIADLKTKHVDKLPNGANNDVLMN